MYYLLKKDFMGNYVPVYAAQSEQAATKYMEASSSILFCYPVPGNKKTLIGM